MTCRTKRRSRGLALSLALCAALLLCGSGIAAAATYEEGGGAAVEAQYGPWAWARKSLTKKAKAAKRAHKVSPWSVPPSGKKPVLQKKAATAR